MAKKMIAKPLSLIAISLVVLVSANSSAITIDSGDRSKFQKDSLHWVTLGELRPTQPVIAHDQVNYKIGAFSKKSEKMYEGLCESYGAGEEVLSWSGNSTPADPESFTCANDIGSIKKDINTVIVGPDGKLYLTDGHHSFSTFFDMKEGGANLPVYIRVQENWSTEESMTAFWQKLEQNNNSWPYLPNGSKVSYQAMPTSLGRVALENDPYRGLMYFARKIGWDKKKAPKINYLEFHWANEFRNSIPFSEADRKNPEAYLAKIKAISEAIIELDADHMIGSSGYTAKGLAQKKEWNKKSEKEFNALLCKGDKKGKLGYALEAQGISVQCQ
ncbi:hypothetical protein CBF23_003975 [Marinomonas agarivorans]|nr:hypothetical protein CBF23_003975 [Marinomonas agarivorans]